MVDRQMDCGPRESGALSITGAALGDISQRTVDNGDSPRAFSEYKADEAWMRGLDFKVSDFDFDDSRDDGLPENGQRYMRPRAYRNVKHPTNYQFAADFADDVEIAPGNSVFAFVSGRFIFGDLLAALVERGKCGYRRIDVMTLSYSKDNVDTLHALQDLFPEMALTIVASSEFYSLEKSKHSGAVRYTYEQLDRPGRDFQLAFAEVHSKVVMFETLEGTKVVLHGSANLRSSRSIEQFEMECDGGLYDFCRSWQDRIVESYRTIDKTKKVKGHSYGERGLGRKALWKAMTEGGTG